MCSPAVHISFHEFCCGMELDVVQQVTWYNMAILYTDCYSLHKYVFSWTVEWSTAHVQHPSSHHSSPHSPLSDC
jgi:hypothetical protein